MPANLFGLPTHILLLHVVIVLLPICAVATVFVVLSGRFRHRWGLSVVVLTFITTLFVPLTTQSGESLADRLPEVPAIEHHAEIGQQLIVWAAVFGLCLVGAVVLDLLRRVSLPTGELTTSESWARSHLPTAWHRSSPGWADPAFRVFQVLALLTAIAVVFMVIRAGHSGAQAVWSHYRNLKPA
ncbi:MAG: hypothetical protein QOG88_1553 [Actinomycetota bacterium]|jgi:uncharacterized membrane protein|nr:hypothetical protein [Actinomycetota bacterium]